ncbi:hypothetical protein [Aliirhizobium cellulosilyticum]|uniref:Uncharacterized protein n=1 Tax=Aliirhizobium cellulosilyticum TaxID=393664 RepID=A0A7W6Y3H3_9HYPH|nr:hypothetical protein [Rhizobium cellulosilyticum]MBB4350485.1 hypothetical protein [Rhizobium cellulosilyticum]MBB4413483.1 hypothetical protein [Rhizobium cellulosilyticum]MBB4448116.1 hypothetical protein [Rhizobium cellulosilyticum]
MVDVNVEIKAEDSPISNAVDLYYSQLYEILNPQTEQKIALNSSLVTFDIIPQAPMFTEYVFRAFADRTVTISPTEYGPVALGVANTNDRYSFFFTEVLKQAVFKLDTALRQDIVDKIDLIDREVRQSRQELQLFYQTMFTAWNSYATQNGVAADDAYYLDKQTAFFNTNNFAEQISYYKNIISDGLVRMHILRDAQYPDVEARHISSLFKYATLDQYLMPRPKDPILEEINKYDPIRLGQAYIYNNLNYFEPSVEIRPSGYLPKFLTNIGKRSVSIEKTAAATHQHDVSWSASGTARKWFFFKASASVSSESHLKETIAATNRVGMAFENLAEYWVNRGPWFSSGVFAYKRIREVLAANPIYAGLLGHAISSVILGRGLELTLHFDKVSTFSEWSKFTASASGSFSVFGMNIPATSGSMSDYKLNTRESEDKKSVTFLDDPAHTRLLGFRVDKLFDGAEEFALAASPYIDEVGPDDKAISSLGTWSSAVDTSAEKRKNKLLKIATEKLLD